MKQYRCSTAQYSPDEEEEALIPETPTQNAANVFSTAIDGQMMRRGHSVVTSKPGDEK